MASASVPAGSSWARSEITCCRCPRRDRRRGPGGKLTDSMMAPGIVPGGGRPSRAALSRRTGQPAPERVVLAGRQHAGEAVIRLRSGAGPSGPRTSLGDSAGCQPALAARAPPRRDSAPGEALEIVGQAHGDRDHREPLRGQVEPGATPSVVERVVNVMASTHWRPGPCRERSARPPAVVPGYHVDAVDQLRGLLCREHALVAGCRPDGGEGRDQMAELTTIVSRSGLRSSSLFGPEARQRTGRRPRRRACPRRPPRRCSSAACEP